MNMEQFLSQILFNVVMEEPVNFILTIMQAVDADIYSMAKGMGNGFPIAGISISPAICSKIFYAGNYFWR